MVFHVMVPVVVLKKWRFFDRLQRLKSLNTLLESSKPNVVDRYCCEQSMHQDWAFVPFYYQNERSCMFRICAVALIISAFITFINSTGNWLQRWRARLPRIILFRVRNDHCLARNYEIFVSFCYFFFQSGKYSRTELLWMFWVQPNVLQNTYRPCKN